MCILNAEFLHSHVPDIFLAVKSRQWLSDFWSFRPCLSACLGHVCMVWFTYVLWKHYICILSSLFPASSLQLPQPPSCSLKRRNLVSRSLLHPTSSIAFILTLTSRNRSLSGCHGNGSRSSKTPPKDPNPSSMWMSSLPWSHTRWGWAENYTFSKIVIECHEFFFIGLWILATRLSYILTKL